METGLRLIRMPVVCEKTSLTKRSVINKYREGNFPQPVLLDARQIAFVESEVDAWNLARVADRDNGVLPRGAAAVIEGRRIGGIESRRRQMAARAAEKAKAAKPARAKELA